MFINGYNRHLKSYDPSLFVDRNDNGVLCVFKKDRIGKSYIFALTDTWSLNGRPIPLGIDRVLDHVRRIDRTQRDMAIQEADALNEKIDQSKKRHMKNEIEAFVKDSRRAFAKATDGILTHSLDKSETKRRIKDRRIK